MSLKINFIIKFITFGFILLLVSCGGGSESKLPSQDSVPPVITKAQPSGIAPVNVSTNIVVTFNESIKAVDFSNVDIYPFDNTGKLDKVNSVILADPPFSINNSSNELTIHPIQNTANARALKASTKYQVNIRGVKDLQGNPMKDSCRWEFATDGYVGNVALNIGPCDKLVDSGAGFNKARGFNGRVSLTAATIDGSGDSYVYGNFTVYNGTKVNNLVRLNKDGTLDASFIAGKSVGNGLDGLVYCITPLPDGDVLVGGSIASYNGIAVNNFVRLNSDSSIDSDSGFSSGSGFSNVVASIVLATDGSGDIYVGGWFSGYKNLESDSLIRLNSDGSLDTAFATLAGAGKGFDNNVRTITPDSNGGVYVGGAFNSYKGVVVKQIAHLDKFGNLNTFFDTTTGGGFDNVVLSIAVTSNNGDIYVGGQFTTYKGVPIKSLVRLNRVGSIDNKFDTTTGGGFIGSVQNITPTIDGSGDVLVVGNISSYNGTSVTGFVRINSNGNISSSFDTISNGGFNGAVQSLALTNDGSGDIILGGSFQAYKNIGVNNLVILNNDASIDSTFKTIIGSGLNINVNSITPATDGSGNVYAAGFFSLFNGTKVKPLIRLKSNGDLDRSFIGIDGLVHSITSVMDGSGDIFVGGQLSSNTGIRLGIARLKNDGTIIGSFKTNFGFQSDPFANGPELIRIVPSINGNSLYVGGNFTSYNGSTVNHLMRLNSSNGNIDSSFDTQTLGGFDGVVQSIAKDSKGGVYVGGDFTSYNGTAVNYLVRLKSDGSIDSSFDTLTGGGFNFQVQSIALTSDTSGIYVGGYFSSYNGIAVNSLIRLNNDGSIDPTFSTPVDSIFTRVQRINITPANDNSGDLFVGGMFLVKGISVGSFARLNSDGTIDRRFNTGSGFNGEVSSIAPADDGSGDVFVGGIFTSYNGTTTDSIVRLNLDGTID